MFNSCSPLSYLPSNVSTSTEEIQIVLTSSSLQDQSLFAEENKSDIKIIQNKNELYVHKIVLQKSMAKLFNRLSTYSNGYYEIRLPSQIKIQILNQVLQCVYGYKIAIRRCQVLNIYTACEYFGINEILDILKNDMMINFDQYQIFPLLKLANRFQIKDVLNYCYSQLQSEQFQPLKYNKSGLLICQKELFKQIIRQHNYFKSQSPNKYGLNQEQIEALILQYCDMNSYTEENKQKLISQIKNENCNYCDQKYLINFSEVNKKISTPIRYKSSSQIFLRNTLSLPNAKYDSLNQVKEQNIMNDKTLSSSRSSQSIPENDLQMIQSQISGNSPSYKTQYSEIFLNNYNKDDFLTENINRNSNNSCRSRNGSIGSSDTAFIDPKVLKMIQSINQSQRIVAEDSEKMIEKIAALNKKAEGQHKQSKYRKAKLQNIQNLLQQIQYDMKKDNQKVNQLEKSVMGLQKSIHQSQRLNSKLLNSKININLTQSTHFGEITSKNNLRI